MNELCVLTNLSSSDVAAWAQATVGAIAIVVGAGAVFWQVRRNRMDLSEREARAHDGLARLLIHLKDCAVESRAEKTKDRTLGCRSPSRTKLPVQRTR